MVAINCQDVLTALNSTVPNLSKFDDIIGNYSSLKNQFHDLSFYWTRWNTNKSALSLTRIALSYAILLTWDSYLSFLTYILCYDASH